MLKSKPAFTAEGRRESEAPLRMSWCTPSSWISPLAQRPAEGAPRPPVAAACAGHHARVAGCSNAPGHGADPGHYRLWCHQHCDACLLLGSRSREATTISGCLLMPIVQTRPAFPVAGTGADFLLEGGNLFAHSGNGNGWDWQWKQSVDYANAAQLASLGRRARGDRQQRGHRCGLSGRGATGVVAAVCVYL